jgi:hypothetical protein
MRVRICLGVVAFVGLFGAVCNATDGAGRRTSTGMDYLSQEPPGRVPRVFAPGIISDAGYVLHGPIVFSPDLREVCWAVLPPAVMSKSLVDGVWSETKPMALTGRGVQVSPPVVEVPRTPE